MKRIALAVALPLMVGGCTGVSPFSVVSFAFDGVSFIATGKTTSAHFLSAMVDKDCSFLNFWMGDPICEPFAEGERALLAELADAPPPEPGVLGANETGDEEDWRQQIADYVAEQEAERLLAASVPAVEAASDISFERLSLSTQPLLTEVQLASYSTASSSTHGSGAPMRESGVKIERSTHLVTATLADRETAQLIANAQGGKATVVEAEVSGSKVYRVAHPDVGMEETDPLFADGLGTVASLPETDQEFGELESGRSSWIGQSFCAAEHCDDYLADTFGPEPDDFVLRHSGVVQRGELAFNGFGSDR